MLNSEFILNFKRFKVADLTNILYEKKMSENVDNIFRLKKMGQCPKSGMERHSKTTCGSLKVFECRYM